MNKRLVSKTERDNIILMDALVGTIHTRVLPHVERYGKATAQRIRTAVTHMGRALHEIYDGLDATDVKKLQKENSQTNVILSSKAYHPKNDTDEFMDKVHTLAEFAMINHCKGCTKDGSTCDLRHALAEIDIPYATTEPENCPYEQ